MKGVAMAGFLTAIAALLTGCSEGRPKARVAQENPPPKPPNCPETSELASVTMSDGSVADVRIVQFGRTKLYLPAAWIKRHFIDLTRDSKGVVSFGLESFAPDIHSVECPGVIHYFIDEKPNDTRIIPIISIWIEGKNTPLNLHSDGIHGFHITKNSYPPGPQLKVARSGAFFNSIIVPADDILVFLFTGGYEINGKVKSESVINLFKWIITAPAKRDNDREFYLSIDGKGEK